MSVAALVLAAATGVAGGAAGLDARLAPREVTVGDRVEVVLTLTVPRAALPGEPTLPADLERWGEAEVLAVSAEGPTEGPAAEGTVVWRWRLELAAFRPGEVELPPLALDLPGAGATLSTPEDLGFTVGSVLPAEGEVEPRPAQPLRRLPLGRAFWATLAGGLLLLAVALAAVLRQRSAAARPALPPRRRLEAALDRLAGLDDVEELHVGVSLALRRYLRERLGLPAPERTTSEIGAALRQGPPTAGIAARAVALLRRCDGVKFARAGASREAATAAVAEARAVADELEAALAPPPTEEAAA